MTIEKLFRLGRTTVARPRDLDAVGALTFIYTIAHSRLNFDMSTGWITHQGERDQSPKSKVQSQTPEVRTVKRVGARGETESEVRNQRPERRVFLILIFLLILI
ncbi:MAG: hypothetical protein C5B50_29620 [Verrucomicrobia bacterium]|nr:MAG: hypothetical protein C5B50_29620 [Verrucomicrobiota bacterium]